MMGCFAFLGRLGRSEDGQMGDLNLFMGRVWWEETLQEALLCKGLTLEKNVHSKNK